ncbi:hypothetical protein VULLAG_LOCUS11140 [Vulpes lagopus]
MPQGPGSPQKHRPGRDREPTRGADQVVRSPAREHADGPGGAPGTRGRWGRRAQTPAPRWRAFCLWTVPPGHLDVDVDREAQGGRRAPDSARDPRGSPPAGKQDPCQLSFMGTTGHR